MSEDEDFHAQFGYCMGVFLSLWGILRTTDLMPAGGSFEHLLWTLMLMRIYSGQKPLCSLAGGIDPDTLWKWTWVFTCKLGTTCGEFVHAAPVVHSILSPSANYL